MSVFTDDDDNGDLGLLPLSSSSPPYPSNPLSLPPAPATTTSVQHVTNPSLSFRRPPSSPVRSNTLPRTARRRSTQIALAPAEGSVQLEPEKLARLRGWILGLVTVNFDLDVGPVIDSIQPYLLLSSSDSENIAFSSFPDSPQFDQGSQCHSFRIRDSGHVEERALRNFGRGAPSDGFVYGYCHFTQQRDSTSKRGYRQTSLVILTHHPYPALFQTIISILGPMYQQHGSPMLETACHNIANWPDSTPGNTVELGFLGSALQVGLPMHSDEQQSRESLPLSERNAPFHVLASTPSQSPPILPLFEASLSHLWSIWECLVLCEPILIFAPSPDSTSQAVWWFRDILRPIPMASDFRPYFTIHDQDHAALVNKMPPKAGLLLGVTNPLIERACRHWPHILSLGSHAKLVARSPPSRADKPSKGKTMFTAAGPHPGWATKTHNRYISKDRALLKQLEEACQGGHQAKSEASQLLRRHFSSRTTALLVPLNRYLNTLIPSPAESASSLTSTLRLKPFSTSDFFSSLKAHGAQLPFRSKHKQKEFYERWLRTPAFGLWLAKQEEVVQRVLRENAERRVSSVYSPRV
ncbi:hypothetical protein JAAARDRAFT_192624 [Jaapia argillacea MUCL 33604]|uniref:UDENN domain-containing protein n=1 Tax=Jaapia argillacea MUCL 33604 TaxID=933084 RepID=A0A067Q6G9_9AGAM|nr:hypothetical protein JAAARDRAFT_192624 [Jaapia argillacea MUCL 33604]